VERAMLYDHQALSSNLLHKQQNTFLYNYHTDDNGQYNIGI
jgi:hypothetical protein